MTIEAMKQALEALESAIDQLAKPYSTQAQYAITSLRQAIEQAEKQEPVAKKRVLEWVEYLKRKSDNGHYMNIPSEMSSGECWELAKELEQFINTTPQPQREWVGLTHDERGRIWNAPENFERAMNFAIAIEAKLKEKNT